jgi:LPS export ABC transporter protein LptC
MNSKIRLPLFIFVALLALGLLVLTVIGFSDKDDDTGSREQAAILKDIPEAVIENVRYIGSTGAERDWELFAERATHPKGSDELYLKKVKFLYFSNNVLSATLVGNEGIYSEDRGVVNLNGDVSLVSEDGYGLTTESLRYSIASGVVTTEARIRFSNDMVVVTGRGLEMDIDGKLVKVLSNVKTELFNKGTRR